MERAHLFFETVRVAAHEDVTNRASPTEVRNRGTKRLSQTRQSLKKCEVCIYYIELYRHAMPFEKTNPTTTLPRYEATCQVAYGPLCFNDPML